MDDTAGAYNLKPSALTDSEYDSESDVGSDANDDPLMTTVDKDGSRITKDPDILVDKKVKVGCTVSKMRMIVVLIVLILQLILLSVKNN